MKDKKTKYITFSICESDYMKIKEKADKDRRPLAQFVALLVADWLEEEKRKEERNAKIEKLRDSILEIEG